MTDMTWAEQQRLIREQIGTDPRVDALETTVAEIDTTQETIVTVLADALGVTL